MARVLQIRRGTTAQNDVFTGMPGEITMDTDTKTLRIHDGETLGGFTLARQNDAATNTCNFDITAVSDDFWSEKIPQFVPNPWNMTETTDISIPDAAAYIEYVFSIATLPISVHTVLVCKNDDAGYSTNDEVSAFGIGNRCGPTPNIYLDGNQLHLRLMIGGESFWASNKSTGETTQINPENWCVKFRVYY